MLWGRLHRVSKFMLEKWMKGTPGRMREKAYSTTTNSLWLECRLPGEMEVGSMGRKAGLDHKSPFRAS